MKLDKLHAAREKTNDVIEQMAQEYNHALYRDESE